MRADCLQGRRLGGHWAMPPPLGAEGALCDCSAPSNRECFTGKLYSWRAPYEKLLRKVPPGAFLA